MDQHVTHYQKNRESYERYRKSPKGRASRRRRASERYYRLKSQGLCVLCSQPARAGLIHCEPCGEKSKANTKKVKERLISQGLCTRCGKRSCLPSTAGRNDSLCKPCYFKKTSGDCLDTLVHAETIGEKLKQQNYRCAYTGELLILGLNDSLDHILPISRFPELRSDPSNVEWVTRKVNCMKWDSTREEFLKTARLIVAFAKQ